MISAAHTESCGATAQVDRPSQALPAPQFAQAPLLAVNTGWLRGDDELRRIFGSRVVDADGREADDGAMAGAR